MNEDRQNKIRELTKNLSDRFTDCDYEQWAKRCPDLQEEFVTLYDAFETACHNYLNNPAVEFEIVRQAARAVFIFIVQKTGVDKNA